MLQILEGMRESDLWKLSIVSLLVILTTAAYLWRKRQSSCENEGEVVEVPKKWVKAGNIKKLILYPIKSCGGIEMERALATPLGLQGRKGSKVFRDRVFLLVDNKGRELCQMKYPKMVLVKVSVTDDERIRLEAQDMEPITFSIPKNTEKTRMLCHLGKSDKNLVACDCGDAVADWYQRYLKKAPGARLVFHIEGYTKEQRKLTPDEALYPTFKTDDLGVFQNETSFLLIAEESITEIDKQMSTTVTHKNFRPTVLVENVQHPFAELKWSHAKIGEGDKVPILKTGRPCDRCPITTNDPNTGVMDTTRELLKTLKLIEHDMGYELANEDMKGKAVMGLRMGLLPTNKGKKKVADQDLKWIHVGDPVYVPSPVACQG